MTRRICDQKIEDIISMYNKGHGTMYIAHNLNISRVTVQKYLLKGGITLRKTSPRFVYDINFFDRYNDKSAYWAGFIAADGYIRPNRATLHIKLAIIDYNHLLKFCKEIQYHYIPKKAKNNSYCYIDVSGTWFVNGLKKNFDISSNKTKNVRIYDKIPKKYLSHFLRGYFDGDGCVTYTSTSSISFSGASEMMLCQIKILFRDTLKIKLKSGNDSPPIKNGKQISYSGKNAYRILKWMYFGSEESTRLDRKYRRFIELFVKKVG